MGFIVKILVALWPFVKEMLLGNQNVVNYFISHKWVVFNLVTTLTLFMLFVGQYLTNMQLRFMLSEINTKNTYTVVQYKTLVYDSKSMKLELESKLTTTDNDLKKCLAKLTSTKPEQPDQPSQPQTHAKAPHTPNQDRSYLNKLDHLIHPEE